MEKESSSGSPDSSCPDYYPYDVPYANRDQSASGGDILTSSNAGNSGNGQIAENLSRNQSYQNNEKSVIRLALRGNGDRLNSTVQSNSRVQNYHNNHESVSNFPANKDGQWWPSDTNNLGYYPANYQNSSSSSGIGGNSFYRTNIGPVRTSLNPPSYSKPEMPYFASSTNMPSAKTTPEIVALPKIDCSNVSSASSDSNYLSIPTSSTNNSNIDRQFYRAYMHGVPVNLTRAPQESMNRPTLSSSSIVPQPHLPSFSVNHQLLETEKGVKRKSPTFLDSSDCLLSTPSSSKYANKEQNTSNESKKSKPNNNLSYLEDDDDIQIITPSTSHSSASLSTPNYHNPSVILDSCSLSSSSSFKPTTSDHGRSQLLDNQSSSQTTQERSSTIHDPLFSEELEHMLDNVWSDLNDITSTNVTSSADSVVGIVSDESSSSSIISIHEVVKDANTFQNSKPCSPALEEVPNELPSLIPLDSSPKNAELQELTAKREAENVKEGFKKLIEDELICNICTEVLIKPITLGCSHTFCKFCISEWKEKKRQCPMCRASIETETPCLFLDNFISKAVEQLDPASVEKRLEVIKSREEEQKKKTYKASIQQSQSPNFPRRLNLLRQNIQLLTSVSQQQDLSALMRRRYVMARQVRERFESQNRPHQSSNAPQASSSMPQISSSIASLSSNVTQLSPSVSQSMFQSPSNMPQLFTPPLHQPNLFYGPPNGFYY